MKETSWPKVSTISKNGKPQYLVDARIRGKGERKYFNKKIEADGWADLQRIKRKNEGESAFDDGELKSYGWTVQRAISFALDHLRQEARSKPLSEAVDALVLFKKGRVGDDRLRDIKNRLKLFVDAYPGKSIGQLDGDDVNAFLQTIPHPATRNDYRKEIVMLWHWARAKPRRWVSEGFGKHEVPKAAEPEKARIILTVDQAESLMKASTDEDIRAMNALVLFGGLRREEVEKLDWASVDFSAGHVNVSEKVSKVHQERFAPMLPALRAWLKTVAKKDGAMVDQANLMRRLRATWKRAGIYPWPQDAHRHSFISYRRQIVGDAKTALEGGTSEKIIKKHYKRPVTAADARRFFNLVPSLSAQ